MFLCTFGPTGGGTRTAGAAAGGGRLAAGGGCPSATGSGLAGPRCSGPRHFPGGLPGACCRLLRRLPDAACGAPGRSFRPCRRALRRPPRARAPGGPGCAPRACRSGPPRGGAGRLAARRPPCRPPDRPAGFLLSRGDDRGIAHRRRGWLLCCGQREGVFLRGGRRGRRGKQVGEGTGTVRKRRREGGHRKKWGIHRCRRIAAVILAEREEGFTAAAAAGEWDSLLVSCCLFLVLSVVQTAVGLLQTASHHRIRC